MVMEPTGHLVRACCTLLAMFAAMCPATSSSLDIVVFHLEILVLEASSPGTVPVSCLTRAIVAAEQARLLASAKRWRSTDLTSLHCLTRLLGTRLSLVFQTLLHFIPISHHKPLCGCVVPEPWYIILRHFKLYVKKVGFFTTYHRYDIMYVGHGLPHGVACREFYDVEVSCVQATMHLV